MNILFIDDNQVEHELISQQFKRFVDEEVSITPQTDAAFAKFSLQERTYDLILCDYNLRNGTSCEDLIIHARTHDKSKNVETPIIVVSATVIYARDQALKVFPDVDVIEKNGKYHKMLSHIFKVK